MSIYHRIQWLAAEGATLEVQKAQIEARLDEIRIEVLALTNSLRKSLNPPAGSDLDGATPSDDEPPHLASPTDVKRNLEALLIIHNNGGSASTAQIVEAVAYDDAPAKETKRRRVDSTLAHLRNTALIAQRAKGEPWTLTDKGLQRVRNAQGRTG